MKILENPTRERNHKLYGSGVERINTVPFSSGFAHDSDANELVLSM